MSVSLETEKKGFASLYDIFSDKLFARKTSLDDETVNQLLKKIETILVTGDVPALQARKLTNGVKEELKKILSSDEQLTNKHKSEVVKTEIIKALIRLVSPAEKKESIETKGTLRLGSSHAWEPVVLSKSTDSKEKKIKPQVVLFIGLTGNGKTTSVQKFCSMYQKRGLKVGCICADTFRAGAFDQLAQNCKKIGASFYGDYTATKPEIVVREGIEKFTENKFDLILVDTAGRFAQSEELTDELKNIIREAKPDQILFVIDASIGQVAQKQADYFSKFGVDGIILTKMDNSNAKGGGAIAAISSTGSRITHIGTGETANDLQKFDPRSYISRLLGFGDVKCLFEKIEIAEKFSTKPGQESMTEKLAKKIGGKEKFTFRDFFDQLEFLYRLTEGKMSSIGNLIPGFQKTLKIFAEVPKKCHKREKNSLIDEQNMDQNFEKKVKCALVIRDSFNERELEGDDEFFCDRTLSRIQRISRGSGKSEEDVKNVIDMFIPMKQILHNIKKLPKNIQNVIRSGKLPNENESSNPLENFGDMDEESLMGMAMEMLPKGMRRGGKSTQMKSMIKQAIKSGSLVK